MKFTSKQYAQALYEILKESEQEKTPAVLRNFIKILKSKKDFKKISSIQKEIENIEFARNGQTLAEISSPYKISNKSIESIKKFISFFLKKGEKSIIVKNKIDKNLIGGFQVRAEDYLIDANVKRHLLKLK